MPDEQLFNHYADIKALEAEKSKVVRIFGDIKAGIKELNSLGLKLSGAGSVKELNAATREYNNIATKLASSQNQLAKAEQQLNDIRAKSAATIKQLSDQVDALKKKGEKPIDLTVQAGTSASQVQNKTTPSDIAAKNKKEEEEASIELAKALEQEEAERIKNATATADETARIEELNGVKRNSRAELVKDDTANQMKENSNATDKYKNDLEALTGTINENLQLQATYKTELAQVNVEIRKLDDSYTSSEKNSEAYKNQLASLLGKQQELKSASADLGKTIELQTAEQNAAVGSTEQLQAKYELLNQAISKLSDTQKDSPVGKSLIKQANDIKAVLKTVDGSSGQLKRQVGNFTGAVSILQNELNHVRGEMQKLAAAGKQGSQAFQALETEEKLLSQATSNQARGFASVTQEAFQLKRILDTLAVSGLKDTEVFEKLQIEYGKVKSKIREIANENKILTSATPGLTALTTAAKGLSGVYALGAGSAAVFAEGNEHIQHSLNKLVAIMTLLHGLEETQRLLLEKNTIATILWKKAQDALNVVVGNSTGVLKGLRIALAATGIGLFLILLPKLIELFHEWGDTSEETKKDIENLAGVTDETKKSLEAYGKTVDEIAKGVIEDLKKDVEELNKEFGVTPSTLDKAIAALQLIQKEYDKTADSVKKAGNIFNRGTSFREFLGNIIPFVGGGTKEKLKEGKENLEEAKRLRAELQALLAKKGIQENQKADLDNYIRGSELIIDANKRILNSDRATLEQRIAALSSNFKERKDIIEQNLQKDLVDAEDDGLKQTQARQEAYKAQIENERDFQEELQKVRDQYADRQRQATHDILNQHLGDQSDAEKAVIDSEKSNYVQRLNAAQKYYDLQKQQIDNNRDLELSKRGLTNKEIESIEAKHNSEMLDLNASSEKQITQIVETESERRKKLRDEERENAQQHEHSQHELNLDQIQHDYDAAQQLLENRFAHQEITEKEYNKRKLKLNANLQIALLQEDIAYTKHLLEQQKERIKADEEETQRQIDQAKIRANLIQDPTERADAFKRISEAESQFAQQKLKDNDTIAASEQKLADLQLKLITIVDDFKNQSAQQTKENYLKTFEDIAKAAEDVIDIVGGLVGAASDAQKNAIQDQIDLLDKQKEKDIEVANASIQNAQDRETAISLIEKNAAAKKEALERRQRQIDQERARFEKAAGIAKIIINTAVAVTKFLSDGNIGQAIFAAALGAAQLAVAIATPIPKFKKGTKDAPGGISEVGEGGKPELIREPSGKSWIADRPMFVNLPKHSQVIPLDNHKIFTQRAELPRNVASDMTPYMSIPKPKFIVNTTIVNKGKDAEILKQLEKLNDKPTILHIHNQRGIESTPWWDKHMKGIG